MSWKELFNRFQNLIGSSPTKIVKSPLPTSGTSAPEGYTGGISADNPFQNLDQLIPKYLFDTDIKALAGQLKNFPDDKAVYTNDLPDNEVLQGDVWTNLILRDWDSGERKQITGLILSNSCDIDPNNNPPPRQRVMFAPTLDLEKFGQALSEAGRTAAQVDNALSGIRRQQDSGIMYLPKVGNLKERFVFLDQIYSQPLSHFLNQSPARVTAFNQYGFYVFLIKVSIHFLRMREGVVRG